jgi:hypothetical protein
MPRSPFKPLIDKASIKHQHMTQITRYITISLCLWLGMSVDGLAQLSVGAGETIKVTSTDELVLLEDLVNNTTIDNLTMGGTAAQNISGTGTIVNLKLNKASGTATILSGSMQTLTGIFTPTAGTLAANGGLILKSDNSGSARIGMGSESGGYITGNVVTQRYLKKVDGGSRTGRAWRLVSIPVTGTGTGYQLRDYFMGGSLGTDLTNSGFRNAQSENLGTVVIGHNLATAGAATGAGYDWIGVPGQVSSLRYYVENPTSGSFASSQVPDLATNYTDAAQGYMLFARGDRRQDYQPPSTSSSSTTLQVTGVLKQGTIEITIPPLASAGYVLVGNPFVSPVDMELIRNDNIPIIQNTFYIWDSRMNGSQNQGGYRTIVRDDNGNWTATGVGTNPQYIESHTAFFVKPTAAGGRLQIKESHKVNGTPAINPHGTVTGLPARLFVNLEIPDTAERRFVDGTVLFFDGHYKDAMGDAVDVPSMSNMNSGVMGLRHPGLRLAMEGRPWPTDTITRSVPVDMRNLRDDPYELRLIAERLTNIGFRAWLLDNHLKKETELKPDGETLYPFRRTGNIGIDSGRFEIVYKMSKSATQGSLTPDDAAIVSTLKIYPNPSRGGDMKLSLGTLAAGRYELRVLDVTGRLMTTQRIDHPGSGAVHSISFAKRLAAGRYLVQIGNADGRVVQTISWMAE